VSKLIHFEDQLAGTNNPDPILYWVYGEPHDGMAASVERTRKSQLMDDLVGMRYERMNGKYPVFINELVEA
jgi:hypothetical protein